MSLVMELARRIEPTGVTEAVETPIEEKSTTTPEGVKDYIKIANFFDVDERKLTRKEDEYLKEIYTWAKSDRESEMFNKLVTKRAELGTPRLGESRLFQIYTWVKLSEEYKQAKDNLLKFENN